MRQQAHGVIQCKRGSLAPDGSAISLKQHGSGRDDRCRHIIGGTCGRAHGARVQRPTEADRTDRLARHGATRTGNARDRECHPESIDREHAQSPRSHFASDHFTDGPVPLQRFGLNAQKGLLGLVGIGHHTAVEPGR